MESKRGTTQRWVCAEREICFLLAQGTRRLFKIDELIRRIEMNGGMYYAGIAVRRDGLGLGKWAE